jgi:hypothetical protein
MKAATVRRLAGAAFAIVLLTLAPATAAHAQGLIVRGGFVGFGTGDDLNCPTGLGVVGGAEIRTAGKVFVGLGGDLYVATPQVCTTMARVIAYDGGYADEVSGVTLLFAPRVAGRVGTAREVGGVRFEPSLVAGWIHAPQLWRDGGRRTLPFAGGALAAVPTGWRFGLVLEHGYQRVPVSHQVRVGDGWRTVHEYGMWKPVFNLGVRLTR